MPPLRGYVVCDLLSYEYVTSTNMTPLWGLQAHTDAGLHTAELRFQ
jgi:hypothetical protein